jgi:thymidylate synthase
MRKDIPALFVEAKTVPEAWEKAVLAVWNDGIGIKTEYDKEDEPKSKDCTMMISIIDPLSEPRIHRAFPGGLDDLEVYRQEVVYGIHDHWINPEEGKWTYTYHKRLFEYDTEGKTIDQIEYIVSKLAEAPHSRRGQAITWNTGLDPFTDDPPFLQRIWCRVVTADSGELFLNMNTHWRSRDAYKASFMNIFALTDLQREIAESLSQKIDKPVSVGRYVDITDSFHIYGSYHREFGNFLKMIGSRTFEQRTWASKFAEPFFKKGRERIAQEKNA